MPDLPADTSISSIIRITRPLRDNINDFMAVVIPP
jgi:hypothetical protein